MDLHTRYYAVYTSSVSGVTGCVKQFATLPQDTLSFVAAVMYHCDVCGTGHRFSLTKTYTCGTPRQHKGFAAFCEEKGIEQGVTLSS